MSSGKSGKSNKHHIGPVAARLRITRHVFRARTLCEGNAIYERAMAEAKAEYDASELRRRAQPKQIKIF
jgi:hypothetical protein